MRLLLARAILWVIHPLLSPMLAELAGSIEQLKTRKIDLADVVITKGGTLKIPRQ